MFVTTVVLHSLLRWLVIAFGLVAVYRAMSRVTGHRPWTPFDDRAGRLFAIALDVQTLVGLLLYGLFSPITLSWGAEYRKEIFYAVEHLTLMRAAIALVHVGRARTRKVRTDHARHRTAAIFYTLGLLLILLGTPWPFRTNGRPLLPNF